jgi:tight adherence protein C
VGVAETLTDPSNVITVLVGAFAFATVCTLVAPMLQGDRLDTRMKSVATRREELRRRSRAQMGIAPQQQSLRHIDEGLIKKIVDRLQLRKRLEDPKVADKLAQAGYRGTRPATIFYFCRFVLPFVIALFAAIYIFGSGSVNWAPQLKLGAIVMAFAAGFYGPNVYLQNRASKRRESIVGAFPDALDLLLICVEAGMSIEAAIQKVADEIGGSSIELAEELSLLTAELSYLPERRMAYEALSRRTNNPGIRAVTTAMIQAERYGTPLGTALRVMAKENRELRIAAAEKKAAQLPAKLTVPMIVFFLPVLFVVVLGPAGLQIADTFGGHSGQQDQKHVKN